MGRFYGGLILSVLALFGARAMAAPSPAAVNRASPPLLPAPPLARTEKSVSAWVEQNLHLEGYAIVGYNNVAVGAYALDKAERGDHGGVRVWIRYEMFEPVLRDAGYFRSLRDLVELDCTGNRIRYLKEERHPDLNLLGPISTTSNPTDWQMVPPPQTLAASTMSQVCRAAAETQPGRSLSQ